MSREQWHVDESLWRAYAAGRLDPVAEASVDAHVTGCSACRLSARAHVRPEAMEQVWQSIRADVSRPELPRSLRWLRRLGVPERDLALLAASNGFTLPWALAVGSALACALFTGVVTIRQQETFLLLAPLVPVLAVVAAYDATDSLRALTTATPYSKLRLALLRTTATLVVALPATMAVGLGIPGLDALAFSWLLPSLALTSSALVLLTWLGPWTACGSVAVVWSAVLVATAGPAGVSALTGPVAQLAFVAVAALMAVVLVLRTTSYRLLGGEG